MEVDFALRYVRIYPRVNSRAELVTLAPGLRPERRFAPLARGRWVAKKVDAITKPKPIKRFIRRYPQSALNAFGRWASTHQWFSDLGPSPSVDDLANSFSSQVSTAFDSLIPLKSIRLCHSDKPWMSVYIKKLTRNTCL